MFLSHDIYSDTKWTIKQITQRDIVSPFSYVLLSKKNKNVINVRIKLDKDYETLFSGIIMSGLEDSVVKLFQ